MNYFELYGLPVSLKVEAGEVRKTFYALNRRYHPDFYVQAGEAEQAEVLERSAQVNRAWKIFQDADETMKYVLELHQLIAEGEKYVLKPDFLLAVMEINEQLMELEMAPDAQQLVACEEMTNTLLHQIYSDVAQVVEYYQEGSTTEKELLQVKDYYYRKKYLQRILDRIHQLRNIASP